MRIKYILLMHLLSISTGFCMKSPWSSYHDGSSKKDSLKQYNFVDEQFTTLNSTELEAVLISSEKININEPDQEGKTVLHRLIEKEDPALKSIIALIVEKGIIDLSRKDNSGKSVMHLMLERNYLNNLALPWHLD